MKELTGTGALVRLILRRDGVWLAIWVLVVALAPIGIAASFAGLYPTAEALQAYARESMNTPAAVAMLGLVYSPTLGGLVAWRTGLQSAILIAPVSLYLVIRHTRTEEETGRRELLGSTVVGRHAPLAAALITVLGANLVIASLIAGGLIGLGLPSDGAIVLGLSAASAGWIFAAVGALAAQLTQSPGAAGGISLSFLGLFYLLRAAGDSGGERGGAAWLTWLSPLGWMRHTRAFAGEQLWVFALPIGLVAALVAVAHLLSARRDLGAGVFPPRLGPATASPGLRSPLALAWRLHRGTLLAWILGFAAFGISLGSIAGSISRFVDAPQLQDWVIRMGAQDAGDAFLFIIMYILSQVAAVYAIMAVLEMRSEEVELRAEPVLSTSVSRLSWASSHLAFAGIGPAAMLGVLGLAIGLIYGLSAGDLGHVLPRLLARAMVPLPAVWVMAGLAAALYGLLPRFTFVIWVVLGVVLTLELGWELGQLSQSVFNLSPFAYVHWSKEVAVAPLIWLAGLAAALTAAGLAGFSRRDVG